MTTLTALSALAFAQARDIDPPPSPRQMRDAAEDPARQACLLLHDDHYRRALDQALAGKPAGLRHLFHFTITEAFVGVGADSHCDILRDLLRYLGDDLFARVLRSERPEVRKAVINALECAWPYPGWKRSDFPLTYRLAPHEPKPTSTS